MAKDPYWNDTRMLHEVDQGGSTGVYNSIVLDRLEPPL